MPKPNIRAQRALAALTRGLVYDDRLARDIYDMQRNASVYHRTGLRRLRQQREADRLAYLDTPSAQP